MAWKRSLATPEFKHRRRVTPENKSLNIVQNIAFVEERRRNHRGIPYDILR